jgi:NUDIX domain
VTAFDYHGALVVVEMDRDQIVLIHPAGGPPEAPASLPSDPCEPGESPEAGAVRMVREMTGLEVVVREFVTFIQPGTPTGTMCAHGPQGPARAYPVDALPPLIPIRVANQRTLDAYLRQLGDGQQDG